MTGPASGSLASNNVVYCGLNLWGLGRVICRSKPYCSGNPSGK